MNTSSLIINGIDLVEFTKTIDAWQDPDADTTAAFTVQTVWGGQTLSKSRTTHFNVGGRELPRPFEFGTDEPPELCGSDQHPNPQEYLVGALNACLVVAYAAGAALRGIRIDSLEIETSGELDLLGFFGSDPTVPPGFRRLLCTVRLKSVATDGRLRDLHESVKRTSPNLFNLSRAVSIEADLS